MDPLGERITNYSVGKNRLAAIFPGLVTSRPNRVGGDFPGLGDFPAESGCRRFSRAW
jgi:hypothetical protein